MDDPGLREELAATWKALPRRERALLASDAARGLRGRNRRDAALMLWWAETELRRGARPAIRLATGLIVVAIGVQLVLGSGQIDLGAMLGSSALPILVLIPLVSWYFRRPKLQRSRQLNAGVLSGRTFDGPPDPQESERLLARARKEGWLRGTRPEG